MKKLKEIDPNDVIGALGLLLVAAGIWWIYPPAGLIAAGLMLIGLAVILALGHKRGE